MTVDSVATEGQRGHETTVGARSDLDGSRPPLYTGSRDPHCYRPCTDRLTAV